MIELQDIAFGYSGKTLFEGLNLALRRGEIAVIRGRSGCGKTSLLKLLSRFHLPTRGSLSLHGRPYNDLRYEELRTRVVYIHQSPVMEGSLSVLENLMLPFSYGIHKGKKRPEEVEIRRLCSDFRLPPELLPREAASLSVGEKQRVAILRAHLLRPEFMLLDEPLANLDDGSAGAIRAWFAGQRLASVGLILASHQAVAELLEGSVRVLEIAEGGLHEHRH
jgi:UDP-glucose/iron transport system ATP-binding protein